MKTLYPPTASPRAARSTTARTATRRGARISPARKTGLATSARRRRRRARRRQGGLDRYGARPAQLGQLRPEHADGHQFRRWDTSKTPARRRRQRRLPQHRQHVRLGGRDRSVRSGSRRRVKRTALGRFEHEGASRNLGRRPAARRSTWATTRATSTSTSSSRRRRGSPPTQRRLAAGAKYLDEGTLYVAKFNADGTGNWLRCSTRRTAGASRLREPGRHAHRHARSRRTSSARRRWTGPSGPRCIRRTARSTSR